MLEFSIGYRSSQHNATNETIDTNDSNEENSSTGATESENTPPATLRENAEAALSAAETAEMTGNFDAAIVHYNQALDRYQTAQANQDSGSDQDSTATIESTQAELHRVETLQEQRTTMVEALQPAERSFQEAILAYIENDRTVARIRFRQARDSFKEAYESCENSEEDLLTTPVEVNVQPNRNLSSKKLSELPAITESAATVLSNADIYTYDDIEDNNEPPWVPATVIDLVDNNELSEETVTTLSILSWWYNNDGYTFDTAESIARREQQANYGFNHTT